MELIISLLMGTRILTLFGGGLSSDAAAVFVPPRIVVAHGEIFLHCRLINAYPDELKKLALTATPIFIYVFVELKEEGGRGPARKTTVESSLVYDMITKTYLVAQSSRADTVRYGSLDSALAASCEFRDVRLAAAGDIKRDAEYSIATFAVLGKARVDALDNKEIDLMYYWNFKRPSFKTEKIRGARFLAATTPANAPPVK